MCGIAGILKVGDPDPSLAQRLERVAARLVHRGPDDFHRVLRANVGLATRRLSVIDLEGGRQPRTSPDRAVTVLQNGEIYNHSALRQDLQSAGWTFETSSDTEVLQRGYEAWGLRGLLTRARGMFALAVLDEDRGLLHLARDRFGQKPLYFTRTGQWFAFASELNALLASDLVTPEIDPAALSQYLACHFVADPRTLLRGVEKLEPGWSLTVDLVTLSVSSAPWWELPDPQSLATKPSGSDSRGGLRSRSGDVAEEISRLFTQAVERCLVADVPVGVFLSGGLDSSLIVAEAARQGAALSTWSIGFEDAALDESAHARAVAQRFGTTHHEYTFTAAKAFAWLEDSAWLDEPVGDPAILPVGLLAREASREVKVVLSGEGADELFAGYSYTHALPHPLGLRRRAQAWIEARLAAEPHSPLRSRDPGCTLSGFPIVANRREALALLTAAATEGAGREAGARTGGWWPAGAPRASSATRSLPAPTAWERRIAARALAYRDRLRRRRYVDLVTWLPGDLLVKLDRATMAASVEGRAPYLDADLAEAAFRLGPTDLGDAFETKRILRRALGERLLPPKIRSRQKQGFVLPMSAWIRGPLRRTFEDVLLADQDDLLERGTLERLLREHQEGRADRGRLLFALYAYRRWWAKVSAV